MSDRQKLFYALLASAVIHLGIGFGLASWTARRVEDAAVPKPDLSQLTVTIMPAPPPIVKPPPMVASEKRPELDSDRLAPSTKAPAHPVFQSDANMVAGSALPASGDVPLPTQAGPRRNFTDFQDAAASFGKGETTSVTSPSGPAMPEQKPYAVTQVQHQYAARDNQPAPTPAPTVAPTPAVDTLALGTPTPTPSLPAEYPTPAVELARLATPQPPRLHPDEARQQTAPEPGTQLEAEKTRIDGGINTAGRPAVDAMETPFGRYHRKLSNLIGSRWQLYFQEHPKDVGEVQIMVTLNLSGKVARTDVIANHSMDGLAELSTKAIVESDFPPVPDDLAPMLRDGKLEIEFTFSVYDPNNDNSGR